MLVLYIESEMEELSMQCCFIQLTSTQRKKKGVGFNDSVGIRNFDYATLKKQNIFYVSKIKFKISNGANF